MSMLNRKLLREIYLAKGLLLTVTSIIAVGVMCFVSMQTVWRNLVFAKERYYQQCRMADFWVDLKKVPTSELGVVEEIPGVTDIRSRISFFATADLPDVDQPVNSLVLSMPDIRQRQVTNDIVLTQGDYFTGRRENEVIVNASFAEQHRIEPGDYIHLLLNNRRQELFVVGTALSSEYAYLLGPGSLIPDPKRFGVFYVPHRYAENVFDFEGAANQVVGHLSPTIAERPDETLRHIEDVLDDYGVFSAIPLEEQTSNQFLSSDIRGMGSMATIIPAIFLSVAALVLNVLITRLARQQRTVVGTLKAMGYGDGEIFVHFMLYGLYVGVAGGLLGCGLGYLCAAGLTMVFDHFYQFPDLRNEFYWSTNAVGLAVSIVCAEVGSLYGAWGMLRLRPAEAMRPEPPKHGGKILLERVTWLWRRLGSTWRLALRGVFRNRVRSLATLFATTMGAGLLTNGFMMVESQNYFLDYEFARLAHSDVDLTFADRQSDDALWEVRRLPGVALAEPQLAVGCTWVNGHRRKKGGITALTADARLTTPHDAAGRRIRLPESGVVVTGHLAKVLDVRVGDTVIIEPVQGEHRPVELTIAGVADSYIGTAAYANLDYMNRQLGEAATISGVQVKLDGSREHERQLYRELKVMPAVRSITNRRDLVATMRETILQNQYVFIVMLTGFSGLMFFGSLVNASLVNLAERQREVATMIALGYSRLQIGGMFFRESMLVNSLGTLLGLPVGYGLVSLTAAAYATDFIRLPVVTAPWIWAATIALSVVFALAAHVAVQWRIMAMDVLQGLKVKE